MEEECGAEASVTLLWFRKRGESIVVRRRLRARLHLYFRLHLALPVRTVVLLGLFEALPVAEALRLRTVLLQFGFAGTSVDALTPMNSVL